MKWYNRKQGPKGPGSKGSEGAEGSKGKVGAFKNVGRQYK
jgi:hypothetical protein